MAKSCCWSEAEISFFSHLWLAQRHDKPEWPNATFTAIYPPTSSRRDKSHCRNRFGVHQQRFLVDEFTQRKGGLGFSKVIRKIS
jgi:hypothetical protein